MTNKEIQLEHVAKQLDDFEYTKTAPIFEIFAAMVAIVISILLFLFPQLMADDRFIHVIVSDAMPQYVWAIMFFVSGVGGALGLLFRKERLRKLALAGLAALYITMTICYGIGFPNVGMVVMGCVSIFSILSIPVVRYTGFNVEKQNVKRRMTNEE